MSDQNESEQRATVPDAKPSPTDVQEAAELLRCWMRLPSARRPRLRMVYRGIGYVSELGYLEWVIAAVGHRAYAHMKTACPVEAMMFRAELEALCIQQSEYLSSIGGAGLVRAYGSALARHAQCFPQRAMGEAGQPGRGDTPRICIMPRR